MCLLVPSVNQQLSGAARGQKAQLLSTGHKSIEWRLQELHGKAEESAHFKVQVLITNLSRVLPVS